MLIAKRRLVVGLIVVFFVFMGYYSYWSHAKYKQDITVEQAMRDMNYDVIWTIESGSRRDAQEILLSVSNELAGYTEVSWDENTTTCSFDIEFLSSENLVGTLGLTGVEQSGNLGVNQLLRIKYTPSFLQKYIIDNMGNILAVGYLILAVVAVCGILHIIDVRLDM